MHVSDIIGKKGGDVVTLPSDSTISRLIRFLTANRIGAVVIVDQEGLVGIVSERDVVRFVQDEGDLNAPVATIMTSTVTTCHLDDEIRELAAIMTAERIRHLPVLERGRLVGIVSIGDVVKARLDDLEAERDHLERYVHG